MHANVDLIPIIDYNHFLYLHPLDSLGLSLIIIRLSGSENYAIWNCAMLITLLGKNKLGFVYGSCIKDRLDELSRALWDKCNVVIIG